MKSPVPKKRQGFRYALAGSVGSALASALLATVRFSTRHRARFDRLVEADQPVLYASWHGRLLPLAYFHRHRGIAALISHSADGEYIARIVAGWGYEPLRGSTSRGGAGALREIARRIRSGQSVAITPDGPRGPRQKLQPGVIIAAQMSGAPILPVVAGCSTAWWPGQWDRFCIPRPFSQVVLLYGEPVHVPRDLTPEELHRQVQALEAGMNGMIEEVDRLAGAGPQSR